MNVKLLAEEKEVFRSALRALNEAEIPYVIGGAFALYHYTGIWRFTKDMDIFTLPEHVARTMNCLAGAGFYTKIVDRHWLAKGFKGQYFVDVIFGEGNWLHAVDARWIERSESSTLLDVPTRIAPVEELIWSKAFVASRDRFDGADIVHLIQAKRGRLDWNHLIDRFREHLQLLHIYVNLFLYVYPSDKDYVPGWVMHKLVGNLEEEMRKPLPKERICRGPLLDRLLFIHDVDEMGYEDPRENLAVRRGFGIKDVMAERKWAARKVHQREFHAA